MTTRGRGGPTRVGSGLRGLSGVLAGGLVALALALVVAAFVAGRTGAPGPGTARLVWHVLAAAVAVPAQWYADRRAGVQSAAAAGAVLAISAGVLAALWFV
ncbi:hypothetical protein [Pseudonocardia nigra]|uniref:hypothetical protein n=1 Tax=Pseudonocardia nigra TaxID=1921578 RepID=UPI001C6000B7|nr:hypothetical protein [Pseudonocardia nigra]